jgi:hypothetical protein
MSSNRSVVYSPEDLALLGRVLDQAVKSMPPTMRTLSNRMEIAKNILACADAGERDPVQLELAALMNTNVLETKPAVQLKKTAGSMTSGLPGSKSPSK